MCFYLVYFVALLFYWMLLRPGTTLPVACSGSTAPLEGPLIIIMTFRGRDYL